MPKSNTKTTGYDKAGVKKLLDHQSSHPTKGKWRCNKTIVDLEFYECEVTWKSRVDAKDVNGDIIPPLKIKTLCPRGMQQLFITLQSKHGRNPDSLPISARDHFSIANKATLEEVDLEISCAFSGEFLLFFFFMLMNTGRTVCIRSK